VDSGTPAACWMPALAGTERRLIDSHGVVVLVNLDDLGLELPEVAVGLAEKRGHSYIISTCLSSILCLLPHLLKQLYGLIVHQGPDGVDPQGGAERDFQ